MITLPVDTAKLREAASTAADLGPLADDFRALLSNAAAELDEHRRRAISAALDGLDLSPVDPQTPALQQLRAFAAAFATGQPRSLSPDAFLALLREAAPGDYDQLVDAVHRVAPPRSACGVDDGRAAKLRELAGPPLSNGVRELLEQAAAELDVARSTTGGPIVAAALAWRAVEVKAKAEERKRCNCGAMDHDPPTSHEPFHCAWVKSGGPRRVADALEALRATVDKARRMVGGTEASR